MATVREINENDDARFGLKFPLEYHVDKGGFFPTSKTLKEQASSNLKNLLLTVKGERVGQPDFGCEITSILFEQITDGNTDFLKEDISAKIEEFFPNIILTSLNVSQNVDFNSLIVDINYQVANTNITDNITLDL